MAEWHKYQIFGLRVLSQLELPEALSSQFTTEADVRILLDPDVGGFHHDVSGSEAGGTFAIEDVGGYSVVGGSTITVRPVPEAPARNVRLYLLGSAFGLLLHQRGDLPLHANGIVLDRGAIAFMGRSGSGKSTLAAWFHDHGHHILTDDVSVVRVDEQGIPVVAPGLPRLRLWRDAMVRSGREPSVYPRSYSGDPTFDKYDVTVAAEQVSRDVIPLSALYLLTSGPSFEIAAIAGVSAVQALFENTYRGEYIERVGSPKRHWQTCVHLAASVPMFVARRTLQASSFVSEAELIRQHAQAMTCGAGNGQA